MRFSKHEKPRIPCKSTRIPPMTLVGRKAIMCAAVLPTKLANNHDVHDVIFLLLFSCWAEARIKIARMTLTIKLDRNWSSFQLANRAPPLSVTDSSIAPSARMKFRAWWIALDFRLKSSNECFNEKGPEQARYCKKIVYTSRFVRVILAQGPC